MKITPSEGRILDVLWRLGRPASSEDVAAALADEAEWSHGTVRTFLTRLVKKKAVGAQMEGRRYLYYPLIDRAAFAHDESRSLLNRLFDGRLAPFVTQFTERPDLSEDDIAELRRLIERLDSGR